MKYGEVDLIGSEACRLLFFNAGYVQEQLIVRILFDDFTKRLDVRVWYGSGDEYLFSAFHNFNKCRRAIIARVLLGSVFLNNNIVSLYSLFVGFRMKVKSDELIARCVFSHLFDNTAPL